MKASVANCSKRAVRSEFMSAAQTAQTARMVLRPPEAKSPVAIRMPAPALRAEQAARAAKAVPVSRTSDPAEREAERVSRRVIGMPASVTAPQARRFATAVPAATQVPAALGLGSSTGQPLPRRLRRDMEPRFQADFSNVRLHTGEVAARASRRLNAAAFTAGRDVFFGRGSFQPEAPAGRQLIAHELTHTIQQGAALQTVHRSVDTAVRERAQPQIVHRLGIQDALDFLADKAAWIPGFSMLALLLGFNPVSLRAVPRTPANLLRAMIQLIPGGPLITQALDNHGIVDKVAAWAEGQLSALGDIGSAIRQSIDDFLDSLSWTDIFDLDGVWARAKRIVTGPIDTIIAFGAGLVGGIITFIKDAILRPIAGLIEPTRGYPLLKAILGFDPVTGDAVPRTPASLLGGFMTLIGQEEIWRNIQQGNAIGQAYAWFEGALSGLMGIVTAIPGTFLAAFQSLQLVDIIIVPRAFARIIGVFGSIAGQFLSWGLGTVIKLLEIIFSVVAPGAMGYLRRAGGALQGIFRNPIGFVMNLVRAAKAGFQRFGRSILRHMQTSIVSWLTGSLPGIYIPQGLSLPEILKFVLSVLGLSWANIRQKLVTAVGEPAVRAMEIGFDLVVTLVRDGPATAWAQMQEQLANLKQMAIDGIIDMVVNLVLTRAVPRLIAMFIPGAGFITAILSIYGTVTTFIAQLSRIAQVITSFLDSMMAIAAGNIEAAAARVETTLAGLLTLAVNFLAGFAGLGRVADQVRGVIARIRAPIDRALDRVVAWVVSMARRVGRFIAQAGVPNDPAVRLRLGMAAAMSIIAARPRSSRLSAALVAGLIGAVRVRYGFQVLEAIQRGGRWWLRGVVNPPAEQPIPEEDADLLRQIYAEADRIYQAARARVSAAPPVAPGTHAAPRVVPAGGGVVTVAANMPDNLGRGRIDVQNVAQGASTPLLGVVQRPGFNTGGDAIVSGATADERRIRVGRYSEVAATLSGIGNDRYAAQAAIEVLRGGDLPARMRDLAGWFGGFKTLMGLEVRRDPIALATLGSVLALAAGGGTSISAAFAQASRTTEAAAAAVAAVPLGSNDTPGGLLSHTATPALAPLRSARDALGVAQQPGASASRGTAAQTRNVLTTTVEAIVRAAQLILRTNARPSTADIVAAVQTVMRGIIGP